MKPDAALRPTAAPVWTSPRLQSKPNLTPFFFSAASQKLLLHCLEKQPQPLVSPELWNTVEAAPVCFFCKLLSQFSNSKQRETVGEPTKEGGPAG